MVVPSGLLLCRCLGLGSLKPSESVGARGTRPVKGRIPGRRIRSGRRSPPLRSPESQHRSDELARRCSSPLTVHPAPHTPYVHQPNVPVQKEGNTVMDHIEIGLGLFEAFTIIEGKTDSAVQQSVAAALVWLRSRLLLTVMNTEVAVLNCTAAIYDAAEESVTVQWHGTSDELAALLDRLAG